ncbi:hypothetical protein [Streptomyces sp. NPDC001975]
MSGARVAGVVDTDAGLARTPADVIEGWETTAPSLREGRTQ